MAEGQKDINEAVKELYTDVLEGKYLDRWLWVPTAHCAIFWLCALAQQRSFRSIILLASAYEPL